MKRKYKLIIEIIGFIVLLILGGSIVLDILTLILKAFSITLDETTQKFITFISSFLLGWIFLEYTLFGKDVGKFLDDIEKIIFSKKKR